MARLLVVETSEEIRTLARDYVFPSFTLAAIPTGRDPRRFTADELYPQLIVQIVSTFTKPMGIGGAMQAYHGLRLIWAYKYAADEDINIRKLQAGRDIFEFLATHKYGVNYQLFMSDESNDGNADISIDYEPIEEKRYVDAETPIGLIKLEAAIGQHVMFGI